MAGENFDEKSKPKMVSLDVIVDVEVIFWRASKKRSGGDLDVISRRSRGDLDSISSWLVAVRARRDGEGSAA